MATVKTIEEIQALGAAIMADAPDSVIESCELDYLINNAEHDLKSCRGYPQESKKLEELNSLYARRDAVLRQVDADLAK